MIVIYRWSTPTLQADSVLQMGKPKLSNGGGYLPLEPGDEPLDCRYCEQTIEDYPHYHTRADYDAYNNPEPKIDIAVAHDA